jgi:hypothetical protein
MNVITGIASSRKQKKLTQNKIIKHTSHENKIK